MEPTANISMLLVLTDLMADLILALSDNQGYSNFQLAKKLGKKESNISKPLRILKEEELIIKKSRECKEDRRRSDFPYYLNGFRSREILDLMIEYSKIRLDDEEFPPKKDIKIINLLDNKDFINFILANTDPAAFFKQFENFSYDPETIKAISKSVLVNATVNEKCKRFLEDEITSLLEKGIESLNDASGLLFMLKVRALVVSLQNFDPVEALNFYKNTIGKTFPELFEKIAVESGNRDAKLLRTFLEYDVAVSPFTSYPVNDPILLLFMKPFERIYDDIYLINESDREMMVRRTYFLYSNFAEMLSWGMISIRKEQEDFETIATEGVFIRSLRKDLLQGKENLNTIIRELIFYWNIASLRLDWLYYELINPGQISPGTNKGYRILLDSDGIQAINLDTNKGTFRPESMRQAMKVTALWSGEADPFTALRYCHCFRELGLEEKQINMDEVVSKVEESLDFYQKAIHDK